MGKRTDEGNRSKNSYKKPKKNVWQTDGDLIRESALFQEYYRMQGIVPEGEFDEFMSTLVYRYWLRFP